MSEGELGLGSSETGGRAGELSFEEALRALEETVRKLESGDLPLEEAMRRFEHGVGLARRCGEMLNAAEKKIELLIEREDGSYGFRPLDEPADGGEPAPRDGSSS